MKKFFRFLKSPVFFLNLFIAILLIVGGVYGMLKYLDTYTLHSQVIKVPSLIGYKVDELGSVVKRMDLQYKVSDSIFIKDKKGGEVLEQHPEEGSSVKSNRTIYVTISAYEPIKIKMPDLVDLSLRQAQTLLQSYGLEVGELEYEKDLCKNCVLEQKIKGEIIEPGKRIMKGTVVDLTVGEGESSELVKVPYCISLTASEASQVLKLSSLNVGALIFDANVESYVDSINAKVYKQIPYFNNNPSVTMGSSVDLFLTLDTTKIIHRINQNDTIAN